MADRQKFFMSPRPPRADGEHLMALALLTAALALLYTSAAALPPGKAWTPVAKFSVPGHSRLVTHRMDTDSTGTPLMFAEARGGIGKDMLALRWGDTTWVVVASLGYGTKGTRTVVSPPGTHYLVWGGLDQIETPTKIYSSISFAQFEDDHFTTPDTVGYFWDITFDYSATVNAKRRWVAVSDLFDMRLFYSDLGGPWSEVPIEGSGINGVAVTALNDTTALVVWQGRLAEPGRAALLRGSILEEIAAPPFKALGPSAAGIDFRRRSSGGPWMSWATYESHVGIATFKDGRWSAPDSLKCAYRLAGAHYSSSVVQMSNDDEEYPVIAWSADWYSNLLPSICVCVPDEAGFPIAENLAESDFGLAPVVTRDRNGDAWVVWQTEYDGWLYWLHSCTTAISNTPQVTGAKPGRHLTWTLSEPAPGSWWAVLRARNDARFEEIARVKAGPTMEMSWTDLSPAAGVLRYKVRRESLDSRYRWESEEGLWPPKSARALALSRPAGASYAAESLELTGAEAGALVVRVFDIQGRLVLEEEAQASGTGRDSVHLDFAARARSLPIGIYFASVRDASGRATNPLKVVILR